MSPIAGHFHGEFFTVQVLAYQPGVSKLNTEQRTQPTLRDRFPLIKVVAKILVQN